MGFANTDVIDRVMEVADDDGVDFLVIDDGSVSDPVQRYLLLTEKLATYVNYIAGPDFKETFGHTPTDKVRIRVLCTEPPNRTMEQIETVYPYNDRESRIRVLFEGMDLFEQARDRQGISAGPAGTGRKEELGAFVRQ